MRRPTLVLLWSIALLAPLAGQERYLQVLPPRVGLHGQRDRVQLVVLEHGPSGTRDVTDAVALTVDGAARVVGTSLLAVADGATTLGVQFDDLSTTVAVHVDGAGQAEPVRFAVEALAVLTRQGCNAGSCHGSPNGKNGFSLSLFAFDPELDARSLTRDGFARRSNVLDPDESLMLKKPTMRLPHVGGRRLHKGTVAYDLLRQWIAEGCDTRSDDDSRCLDVRVEPAAGVRSIETHARQQLRVVATFADNSERDVTHLAAFTTTDKAVATVSENGVITAQSRGDAIISVRYLDRLAAAAITFTQRVPGFRWPDPVNNNLVDELVHQKLEQLHYLASEPCTDNDFVRRLYLDLTGLLPLAGEARAFVADASADKRDRLIERLLGSPEHARFWAQKLADVLKVNRKTLKERANTYGAWLEQQFADNRPHDQLVRDLLTAGGPPALYYQATTTATDLVETTTQAFLGARLACAKCHNHPFESWTQDDYFRMAAAFVKGTEHPLRKREMRPWPVNGDAPPPASVPARRQAFATWLTSRDNLDFARATVNRMWAELFGPGLVDPVDDFRASNPPANAPLLDALARQLVAADFDRRHVLRLLLRSATYQRSSNTNDSNQNEQRLGSHQLRRPLSAEQVRDAVRRMTATPQHAELRDELAAATASHDRLLTERSAQFGEWLAQRRTAFASGTAATTTPWHGCGPFGGAFGKAFAPERGVDLEAQPAGKQWLEHPEWLDGEIHQLDLPAQSAIYLFRTLQVPTAGKATLHLGSDDGIKVWLRGEEVFARNVGRGVAKDQDLVEVQLQQGRNDLLVKVHNKGGAAGFYFDIDVPLLSAEFRSVVQLPDPERTAAQTSYLQELHLASCGDLIAARQQSERLQASFHGWFATQSAVPPQPPALAEQRLMRAFGQPERETACACERREDPSLQQALQILNGPFLRDSVQDAVATYGALDDDELVTELWWAAYSRPPRGSERTAAVALLTAGERATAIEDLVWTVASTTEFLFRR